MVKGILTSGSLFEVIQKLSLLDVCVKAAKAAELEERRPQRLPSGFDLSEGLTKVPVLRIVEQVTLVDIKLLKEIRFCDLNGQGGEDFAVRRIGRRWDLLSAEVEECAMIRHRLRERLVEMAMVRTAIDRTALDANIDQCLCRIGNFPSLTAVCSGLSRAQTQRPKKLLSRQIERMESLINQTLPSDVGSNARVPHPTAKDGASPAEDVQVEIWADCAIVLRQKSVHTHYTS